MLQALKAEGLVDFDPQAQAPRPSHWLIGIAQSAREVGTVERIGDLGIGPYLPLVIKQRRAGRNRLREVPEPLLRPYFFVPTTITDQDYHDILNTRGVIRFLEFDGRLAVVRDAELDRARAEERYCEERRLRRILESGQGPRFIIGEEVKITVGFATMHASVHKIGAKRIKVKLSGTTLFGRDVVEVDLAHIQPV